MPPPVQPLSISHARAGGQRIVVLHGDLDLESAPGLIAAFARAVDEEEALAVDLAGAGAADAGGMALLVHSVRRLHHLRGDVRVVCPPGTVRTAFERTALARRITLIDEPRALHGASVEPCADGSAPLVVGGHRQRASTSGRRGALLAEATLAMEARHPDPSLGLDDVAREIATSSRQLQRVFSELAGSAFRDELAAVRMQHGAVLLQTTGLPVAEVARRVGYRQGAQFAKAFRRHNGLPPSILREEMSD